MDDPGGGGHEECPSPLFLSLLYGWRRQKEGVPAQRGKEETRGKKQNEKERKNAQMAPPLAKKNKE